MNRDNTNSAKNIKQRKTVKKLSERYLRNAGEYYLNRYPASSSHFLTVMTRKIDRSCLEHDDQNRQEWIDHVQTTLIPYFTKLGFLNDDLYAKGLLNSLKNKGLSRFVIERRMRTKGIAMENIQILFEDEEQKPDDYDLVEVFARKKKIGRYNTNPKSYDADQKRRDLGKLARAGFSYELAMRVIETD